MQSEELNRQRLLNQFQHRYPTGTLISELLTIHQGQYVVRVVVQVGGSVMTTAMAAAESVEQAEDRAKLRALEAIGLRLSNLPTTPLPSLTPLPSMPGSELSDLSGSPGKPRKTGSPALAPSPPVKRPQSDPSPDWSNAPDPGVAAQPPISESSPDLLTDPSSVESLPVDPERSPLPEPDPFPVSEPQDYSDIIAQIGIQMDRVGWSKEQGRDYLQSRYNKKSRQQLTYAELIDFLAYLESLPANLPLS